MSKLVKKKIRTKPKAPQRPIDVGRKRSGKNINTRRKLSATADAWRLMDQVRGTEPWTDWARRALARDVARSLRADESSIVALFAKEN